MPFQKNDEKSLSKFDDIFSDGSDVSLSLSKSSSNAEKEHFNKRSNTENFNFENNAEGVLEKSFSDKKSESLSVLKKSVKKKNTLEDDTRVSDVSSKSESQTDQSESLSLKVRVKNNGYTKSKIEDFEKSIENLVDDFNTNQNFDSVLTKGLVVRELIKVDKAISADIVIPQETDVNILNKFDDLQSKINDEIAGVKDFIQAHSQEYSLKNGYKNEDVLSIMAEIQRRVERQGDKISELERSVDSLKESLESVTSSIKNEIVAHLNKLSSSHDGRARSNRANSVTHDNKCHDSNCLRVINEKLRTKQSWRSKKAVSPSSKSISSSCCDESGEDVLDSTSYRKKNKHSFSKYKKAEEGTGNSSDKFRKYYSAFEMYKRNKLSNHHLVQKSPAHFRNLTSWVEFSDKKNLIPNLLEAKSHPCDTGKNKANISTSFLSRSSHLESKLKFLSRSFFDEAANLEKFLNKRSPITVFN